MIFLFLIDPVSLRSYSHRIMATFGLQLAALFLLLSLSYTPLAVGQTCSTAQSENMDADFLSYLNGQQAKPLAIMPFYDNHVGNPDDGLYHGIPFLIFDMYGTTNEHLLHPFASFAATNKLGLGGETLIVKENVKKFAQETHSEHVIFGSFQRSLYDTVRVMINVYTTKSDSVLAPAVEFTTDFNDSFFSLFETNVSSALSKAKAKGILQKPKYAIPTMKAFRYYCKGLHLADSYNLTDLELASLWFEKALKENYHNYEDAALALARVHFMAALLQKLQKIDYTQFWLKGQRNLVYIRNRPQKDVLKYKMTFRFVDGARLSTEAAAAFERSLGTANALAASGLLHVPEDGILQHIYKATLGKKKAKKGISMEHPVCF